MADYFPGVDFRGGGGARRGWGFHLAVIGGGPRGVIRVSDRGSRSGSKSGFHYCGHYWVTIIGFSCLGRMVVDRSERFCFVFVICLHFLLGLGLGLGCEG